MNARIRLVYNALEFFHNNKHISVCAFFSTLFEPVWLGNIPTSILQCATTAASKIMCSTHKHRNGIFALGTFQTPAHFSVSDAVVVVVAFFFQYLRHSHVHVAQFKTKEILI